MKMGQLCFYIMLRSDQLINRNRLQVIYQEKPSLYLDTNQIKYQVFHLVASYSQTQYQETSVGKFSVASQLAAA